MNDSNTVVNKTKPNFHGSQQPQTNMIIRNKAHTKYLNNQNQERLPSISEWFEQPNTSQTNYNNTTPTLQSPTERGLFNNNFKLQNNECNISNSTVRNRSISNGTTVSQTTFSSSNSVPHHNDLNSNLHNSQSMLQNIGTKPAQNGRGKAPHSRVRSVPPIMMGSTMTWNPNNSEVVATNNPISSTSTNSLSNSIYTPNSCNIISNNNSTGNFGVAHQPSQFNLSSNYNIISQTVNSPKKLNSITSQPSPSETKNDFVLVIENEESIKQYSERASLHNPNPFNPLSRRISAKEVWNSIAAATQANKIMANSPKIKKQNKMSISTSVRNRSSSPTSSNNTNLTQNSFNQSLPLSSITIRSRRRSNSNPLVLPFDKLTLEDSPNIQANNSNVETSDQLHLLGNEFVDFSNGEHESQRKNRGEKVLKFKMINF